MQCNVDCGLLKASRSSHTYYTPPLLPPTQDVVHRRSRLKFLSSSLFDPLNAAVVVVVAEAAALKRNFLLQYSFSFLPSFTSSVAQNGAFLSSHGRAGHQSSVHR